MTTRSIQAMSCVGTVKLYIGAPITTVGRQELLQHAVAVVAHGLGGGVERPRHLGGRMSAGQAGHREMGHVVSDQVAVGPGTRLLLFGATSLVGREVLALANGRVSSLIAP